MTANETRERLAAISTELSTYLGVRTHALLAEFIDIVAGMLPAEPAQVDAFDLPQVFIDREGDRVEVLTLEGMPLLTVGRIGNAWSVRIEPHDVDRFVAAVLKAAGR